ncbi:stabilizer of axonemal microtubules 3 [Neoarius graeffei]|uniref:stabilizer of axonemal microtubules 3 n=1 Tax=Neoarius graeffei TaxID=443677 RepID=UPI00298C6720|nr:stabilizer of axonemal microtubules 3 [Neoarius graeffei]
MPPTRAHDAPLPPVLQRRISRPQHYIVTSYTEHDPKPVDGVLSNVIYSKAPPHWRTHFLNDLAQKLRDTRSVRLVSAPPVTEMQEQYRGRSAPYEPQEPHYRTLQAQLGQIHQSSGLLLPKEPALSTTRTDYRHFSRSELAPLSALDASPTCGPFTKRAALIRPPPHSALPGASSQLQLPRPSIPVPHGGRSSVYMDSFSRPAPPPMSSTHVAVLAETKRTEESGWGLLQHIPDVPEMYSTENQMYGKGRLVLV